MTTQPFSGFPPEALNFLAALSVNNEKSWFDAHKRDYEKYLLEPSRAFVVAMGRRLKELSPGIIADPRTNKSLFRIYRDVRFRRDKSPYKTHVGIWFWEGSGPRMSCSGFYFHIEPAFFMVGAGLYKIPCELLDGYRHAVVDARRGPALRKAVDALLQSGVYSLGGKNFKKVPRGFDSRHPNAAFLLHDGFYIGRQMDIPDALHSPSLVDFCFAYYREMLPVHLWLRDVIEAAKRALEALRESDV